MARKRRSGKRGARMRIAARKCKGRRKTAFRACMRKELKKR